MNKKMNRVHLLTAISFVAITVIAFLVPLPKTATFYVSYAFTVVAFGIQAYVSKKYFVDTTNLKDTFYKIPMVHMCFVYVVVQVLSFVIFAYMDDISWRIVFILDLVILGIFGFKAMPTNMGIQEVKRVDEKIAKNVHYMSDLQFEIEQLARNEKDEEIQKKLNAFAERVRYSDPMGNVKTEEMELQLVEKVNGFTSIQDKALALDELNSLLDRRNHLCKAYKDLR